MFGFPGILREMIKHIPFGIKSSIHCEDPQLINLDFLYNEGTKPYVIPYVWFPQEYKLGKMQWSNIIPASLLTIFCSIPTSSFKLLLCTLQFPFIPVLSEPSFPNCSY